MGAPRCKDRPEAADLDPPLRMLTAAADTAFVADGIALGLPLYWAGWTGACDDWLRLAISRQSPAWPADRGPPPGDHGVPGADHTSAAAGPDILT